MELRKRTVHECVKPSDLCIKLKLQKKHDFRTFQDEN